MPNASDSLVKAAFLEGFGTAVLGRTIMTFDDKEKEGGMRQPGDESGGSQPSGTGMNQPGGGTSQPGQSGGGQSGRMNQPSGGQSGGMNQPGGAQPGGMGQDKNEDRGTTGG